MCSLNKNIPSIVAITPEATEKITAPRASPDPLFNANSQNVFAKRYAPSAPEAKRTVLCNDYSLANMSAINLKVISNINGSSHFIKVA